MMVSKLIRFLFIVDGETWFVKEALEVNCFPDNVNAFLLLGSYGMIFVL